MRHPRHSEAPRREPGGRTRATGSEAAPPGRASPAKRRAPKEPAPAEDAERRGPRDRQPEQRAEGPRDARHHPGQGGRRKGEATRGPAPPRGTERPDDAPDRGPARGERQQERATEGEQEERHGRNPRRRNAPTNQETTPERPAQATNRADRATWLTTHGSAAFCPRLCVVKYPSSNIVARRALNEPLMLQAYHCARPGRPPAGGGVNPLCIGSRTEKFSDGSDGEAGLGGSTLPPEDLRRVSRLRRNSSRGDETRPKSGRFACLGGFVRLLVVGKILGLGPRHEPEVSLHHASVDHHSSAGLKVTVGQVHGVFPVTSQELLLLLRSHRGKAGENEEHERPSTLDASKHGSGRLSSGTQSRRLDTPREAAREYIGGKGRYGVDIGVGYGAWLASGTLQ